MKASKKLNLIPGSLYRISNSELVSVATRHERSKDGWYTRPNDKLICLVKDDIVLLLELVSLHWAIVLCNEKTLFVLREELSRIV